MRDIHPRWRCLLLAAGVWLWPASARCDPTSFLDREVVADVTRRAVSHVGLASAIGSMALRARLAAWLPTVGASLSMVQGGSLTEGTTDVTDRLLLNNSTVLAFHMSLALDRLVFDPREAAIARAELNRTERVMALEALVVELLGRMERARLARVRLPPGGTPDPETELTAAMARARLELLLGGPMEPPPHGPS